MSKKAKIIFVLILGVPTIFIMVVFFKFVSAVNEAFPEQEKKTICECVNEGKQWSVIKKRDILMNGTSDQMKKFEEGLSKWQLNCSDLLNPTEASGIMKLNEELKKCQ
jgi:hypothetical protein